MGYYAGLQCIAAVIFNPATGAIVKGFGATVTLNTASREWTIAADADVGGPIDQNGCIAEANISSVPAAARSPLMSWDATPGSLVLKSVDFTGALADATGNVRVVIYRLPPSN